MSMPQSSYGERDLLRPMLLQGTFMLTVIIFGRLTNNFSEGRKFLLLGPEETAHRGITNHLRPLNYEVGISAT